MVSIIGNGNRRFPLAAPPHSPLTTSLLTPDSLGFRDDVAHFTRVNVVVLQKTAATHPDRSTAVLLLTVRVPE